MLSFTAPAGFLDRIASNIVRDTNTAVKTLAMRPKNSVVAKPRMGPVPNWNRNAAAISDAMCVSRIVTKTRSKLAPTACRALCSYALEDQHVRVDAHADREDEAGDARQGHGRAEIRHEAKEDHQVHQHGHDRVEPGELVVDEHEDRDEEQPGDRRGDAG